MDTTSTSIPHPISTTNSVCSSLDSDLSSDLDLDLFQPPVETAKSTNLELDNPDLVLFRATLQMDITQLASSPSGVNFMPSSPPPDPTGIVPWPQELVHEYIKYLELDSTNRSVLTGAKRNTIRTHLSNPNGRPPLEYTPEQRAKFNNDKHDAITNYELQDNQVYRKARIVRGVPLRARYCACIWDSFEIICKVHLQLHHFGSYIPYSPT
jgi:hypothetical protein